MKKKKFTDDDLIFVLIVMFLFALFGHNLRKLWEPEREYSRVPAIETIVVNDFENYGEEDEDETKVTVTQYSPVPEQCDEDPLVTADNSVIDLRELEKGNLKWVAVSRDLLGDYNYGDIIELTGSGADGRYEIHDTMHPRFTNRVDILTPIGKPTDKWLEVSIRKIEGGA